MMRMPGTAAIKAAELRHRRSVEDVRAAAQRSVAAYRAALSRPSTLALAAAAGFACGLRRARRRPPAAASAVAAPGTVAVVLAFALRYAMQSGANAWLQRRRTA